MLKECWYNKIVQIKEWHLLVHNQIKVCFLFFFIFYFLIIFSFLGYPPNHPYNSNTGQRLSPQQQQQLAFQAASNTNNISQVSPRQASFTQGPQTQQQQQQQTQPQPNQTQQQWNAANTRLSLQQQQNPMLNAQLTVSLI